MNIVIYVLCYDEQSRSVAETSYGKYPWARVKMIPSSPYLENVLFFQLLDQCRNEWEGSDYVGCVSYRAFTKMRRRTDVAAIVQAHAGADVVTFNHVGKFVPGQLLKQAQTSHRHFTPVWTQLLHALGYEQKDYLSNDIRPFFCNYWAATPKWMDKYIAFSKQVKTVLDTFQPIQALLWSDSGYKGNIPKERLLEIFGKSYYPLHPFVFERLPCFFFWVNKCAVRHCT